MDKEFPSEVNLPWNKLQQHSYSAIKTEDSPLLLDDPAYIMKPAATTNVRKAVACYLVGMACITLIVLFLLFMERLGI